MTGVTTDVQNKIYGNGVYIVNSSSTAAGTLSYSAFDYTGPYWRSQSNYNADGSYKNTFFTNTVQQGPINGEWLEIKLPEVILLEKIFVSTRANGIRPKKMKL